MKDKSPEQKVLFEFLAKYPELEEHLLYSYAAISAETYERIKSGKNVKGTTKRKLIKAINYLDSLRTIDAIEEAMYANLNTRSRMPIGSGAKNRNESQDKNVRRQMELGGLCIQYGISKADLMRLDSIRKYGKQEIIDYVIDYVMDHHMTLKSCKKVYEQSKAFDSIGWTKVI